jgi:hypothetical protein
MEKQSKEMSDEGENKEQCKYENICAACFMSLIVLLKVERQKFD